MPPQGLIFEFDDVRVNSLTEEVFKAGQRLTLEPKAFRVLLFFLQNRGRLIEKEELLSAIWPDTFVSENVLTRDIALLRKALGDQKRNAQYTETVPTRGYRLVAQVTVREIAETQPTASPAIPAAPPQPSASWFRRRRWIVFSAAVLLVSPALFVLHHMRNAGHEIEYDPVQMTNSTGLDLYPSFSPDGNLMAYSSDETGTFQIYLRQMTPGGSTVQLTKDDAENLQPTFSPDGKMLAFYSQRKGGIWIIPALGGTARQVTSFGSTPSWSPDGSEIVFQSAGTSNLSGPEGPLAQLSGSILQIVSLRDGAIRKLTEPDKPPGAHHSPAWSPDGKTVAFIYDRLYGDSELWSVAVDSGSLQPIANDGLFFDPAFAPDGRRIYVPAVRDGVRGIWEFPVPGADSGIPSGGHRIFSSLSDHARGLAISPDGREIAFSRLGTISNLYSLPFSGTIPARQPTALTHDTRYRKTYPSISSDGRRILFEVMGSDRDSGVWVMDADGNNARLLNQHCEQTAWLAENDKFACVIPAKPSNPKCKHLSCFATDIWKVDASSGKEERIQHFDQDAEFSSYSRDGKTMAFMSAKAVHPNVWVASLEGGGPRQVTFDPESMGFPSWSPDGKTLAIEAKRGDTDSIYLLEPGKTPVQLTRDSGHNWPYSWSPDGNKIAFASNRGGSWNLWWVSRRDGSEKQLTHYERLTHYVRYPAWSPTGNAMVYEYGEITGNIWTLEAK
jgi:Tol biopolymer transport system component/DNA-binding winged helix-turn-helix (wHTH) protein